MLKRAGRHEEAMALYQRAAEAGDPQALHQTVRLLKWAGRLEEAARLSVRP